MKLRAQGTSAWIARSTQWVAAVAALGLLASAAVAAEVRLTPAYSVSGNYGLAYAGVGDLTSGAGTLSPGPVIGTVDKAFLYWSGANLPHDNVGQDDTVTFGLQGLPGTSLTADLTLITDFEKPFAPGTYFWDANVIGYVEDVTTLVSPGTNVYEFSDFDMDAEFGAGLQIIYQDDSLPVRDITVYQGNDFAFRDWPGGEELNRTWVLAHEFAPEPFDREVEVVFFLSGGAVEARQDQLWFQTGTHGHPGELPEEIVNGAFASVLDSNPVTGNVGNDFDVLVKTVTLPAGNTYVAFQFQSGGGSGDPALLPESFNLLAATVSVVPEPATLALLGFGALTTLRRRR
jgi:uncharacterized membrane protein